MSFLYPLFWLGALAIGAPLWLHLRRKDESNIVHFSAMRFLEDQPLARSRPMWPRDWLLLLLRMLIVLLIVAAFSWPFITTHRENLIRESRVYILDSTLSNRAAGQFDAAREQLIEEVSSAAADTQIAVVELRSGPEVIIGWGDDAAAAKDVLTQLRSSHQRGTYLSAFRTADELLEQSLGESKRIVLVGDSQQNQWQDGLQTPPFLTDVDIDLPPAAAGPLDNLGLTEPMIQRQFLGDRVVVRCSARLNRFGKISVATVSFLANGNDVHTEEVAFAADADSSIVFAEFESDPAEWLRVRIHIDEPDDALAGDDAAFVSLPPVREGRAVAVTGFGISASGIVTRNHARAVADGISFAHGLFGRQSGCPCRPRCLVCRKSVPHVTIRA